MLVVGDGTEQASCHGHEQAGGNALAADVSYAEEQFLVPYVEVVEVSSHFLCRHNCRRHIYVVPAGERREGFGKHGTLDVAGRLEFALYAGFALRSLIEFLLVLDGEIENHYEEDHTKDLEKHHYKAHLLGLPVNLIFRDDDGHRPARAGNGVKEHTEHLALVL